MYSDNGIECESIIVVVVKHDSGIACESLLYRKAWSLVTGERSVVPAARLLPVGRSSYTGLPIHLHLHLHWCADTLTVYTYTGEWVRYNYTYTGVWIQLEGLTLGRCTIYCVDNPPQAYSLRCGIHTVDTVLSSTQTKPSLPDGLTLRRNTTVWIQFLCASIHGQTKPS